MNPIEWIVDAFVDRPQTEPRAHVSSGDPIRRHEAGMDGDLWRAFLSYAECRKGLHGEVPPDTDNLGRVLSDGDVAAVDIGRALMLLGSHDAGAMRDGLQTRAISAISAHLLQRLAAIEPPAASIGPIDARSVRLVVIDIDGVLTDGSVSYGPDGVERQVLHGRDELGIEMMIASGIVVALVSERAASVLGSSLAETDGLVLALGAIDKRAAVSEMQERMGIPVAATAVIGDDAPDVAMLDVAALAFAPADAMPVYRDRVGVVLTRPAGNGAVREMADILLAGRSDPDAGDGNAGMTMREEE